MTIVQWLGLLGSILTALGGASRVAYGWWRDARKEDRDEREAAAKASEARTERVVTAIVASTASSDATRAALVEMRAAIDRLAATRDSRVSSERIVAGSAA